jgi:hypothetical protein
MFRHHELHTLTGSYVLDAVETPERERFERHLRRCPSCLTEVGGLRETAARLAMAAAAQPPAPLREQVLAMAARTRQLHPVTVDRPAGRPRLGPDGTGCCHVDSGQCPGKDSEFAARLCNGAVLDPGSPELRTL